MRFDLPDWITHHTEAWRDWLAPFIGQPCIGLEIGSCEGRSSCWFLDSVLTHQESKLWCIDPWEGHWYDRQWPESCERNFDENLSSYGQRVVKVRSKSQDWRQWPSPIAFARIDGSHFAHHVAWDGLTAWDLLQLGGVLIFDDYGWTNRTVPHPPRHAIDFLLDVLPHRGYEIRAGEVAVWK